MSTTLIDELKQCERMLKELAEAYMYDTQLYHIIRYRAEEIIKTIGERVKP